MKSNYQVKIETSFNEIYLCVTHNGSQWNSIRINNIEREIPKIIKILQKELKAFGKPLSKIDLNNGTETPELKL